MSKGFKQVHSIGNRSIDMLIVIRVVTSEESKRKNKQTKFFPPQTPHGNNKRKTEMIEIEK